MGAGAAVQVLTAVPERPTIQMVATLGQGDTFGRMLQRAGVGAELGHGLEPRGAEAFDRQRAKPLRQRVAVGADVYTQGSKSMGSVLVEGLKIAGH